MGSPQEDSSFGWGSRKGLEEDVAFGPRALRNELARWISGVQ